MKNIKKIKLKNGETRYELNAYLGVDPHTGIKKKTKRRYKSLQEARLARSEFHLKVHSNEVGNINNYTFEDVYNLWMSSHKNEIRGTTLDSKKSKFRTRILPKFGHLKIRDIKPFYCQSIVNEWTDELKTVQDYTIQLNLVFKFATRMEFIKRNPMDYVVIPKREEEKYYKKEKQNFYTRQELKIFLDKLSEEGNTQHLCLFHLLSYLGLRKGEALALHWSDIDWNEKTVEITKTIARANGKAVLHHPKTKESIRKISVDDVTLRLLQRWKLKQISFYQRYGFLTKKDSEQPIFTRFVRQRNTMDYWREATPNDILYSFYKRHPKLRTITVHGFRHTHASLLFESGANIKDVQARLGHSDVQTTMNIYVHVTDVSRERVAQLFSNFMNE